MADLPFVTVLLALKDVIDVALSGRRYGPKNEKLTIRHYRHREAKRTEWPALSIRYMSADPSTRDRAEDDEGNPEQIMELSVNLQIDTILPPEADDLSTSDADPTGFGTHAAVMADVLDLLMPGGDYGPNTLGGVIYDLRYDGSAPEEGEATPDQARLEERLVLFYRVRADQPTILLRG